MRLSGLFLFDRIRKWRMERKMTDGNRVRQIPVK